MGGTQTIWRAGFAPTSVSCALLASLGLLGACDFGRKGPERSERPRAALPLGVPSAQGSAELAVAEPDAAAPLPAPITEALQSVHDQRLDIAPPRIPAQRLAFGAARLLQARDSAVVFLETKQGEVVSEVSIGSVRAVAHGSDGSLCALGADTGVRLDSRALTPMPFPRATFFPGSLLFGDLEEPAHFYVFYTDESQLYRYPFEVDGGALLPIELQSSFDGCKGAPVQLRDGAFACRTASGFLRKAPRGRRTDFKSVSGLSESLRLLPAKRLDELFSVSQAGEVTHVRLAPGVPVLGSFRLPAPPYAAAANGEALAFVLVSPAQPGQPRAWSLLVTDFDGQARLQAPLPSKSAPADEHWLEALVEDKNLAISSFEPLVAVGGSAHVVVWDYAHGGQRFAR